MTDAPTGRQLVEKTFVYMTTLSRECRKSLTTSFGQTHKGIPFEAVEPTLRQEVDAWFLNRDRNITVKHEKSDKGRPGEISMTYAGATKDANFKFHVDAQFTLAGSSEKAPSYLKTINVNVDKRDFTK
jgi:5-hydroxyisourate hydrolase-like protein (transthyretin family)